MVMVSVAVAGEGPEAIQLQLSTYKNCLHWIPVTGHSRDSGPIT